LSIVPKRGIRRMANIYEIKKNWGSDIFFIAEFIKVKKKRLLR
tara:strand:+ start:166 stop:294 length:129 start_codon:yes stop_codon:yes gene_type:complete